MRSSVCFLVSLHLLAGSSAYGQAPIVLSPAKIGQKIPSLTPVTAPSARCIAIGETAGWLAFGHEKTFADAHVSLIKLDAKGNPAAYSIPLKLPRPAGLGKHANYPLALAFHPRLPVLYVWQDIAIPYTNPEAAQPPDLKNFDHLHIYSVAKEPPELLASLCRGPEYLYGSSGGALLSESSGGFLYVPNLKDLKNSGIFRFGRFALDEAGLPKLEAKDAALPLPARLKRLAELNAAKPIVPQQITLTDYVTLFPFNPFGSGMSFVEAGPNVVIAGGHTGLISWRPDDKRVTLSGLAFRHHGYQMITGHSHLPSMYSTLFNSDMLTRAEQVEGYLTMVPQTYKVPDANLYSQPSVFDKGKKLAIGGRYRIYVLNLDDTGRCLPEVVQVPIMNPAVQAMAYSQRFDRLYVSIEVSK
jgi:hypothetical protein